jgi:hypothetical protein
LGSSYTGSAERAAMSPDRNTDLRRFYQILTRLEDRLGGARKLCLCRARSVWPKQGVYFFFEQGETRTGSGMGLRVVRVGTHAVACGSKATLWSRLRTHKGTTNLGGNHRGSVFRLLVGSALASKDMRLAVPTWAVKPAQGEARLNERELESKCHAISAPCRSCGFPWRISHRHLAGEHILSATALRC